MGVWVRGYLQKQWHLEDTDNTEIPTSALRRIHERCSLESPFPICSSCTGQIVSSVCTVYCFCNSEEWPCESCQFQKLSENFLWIVYLLSLNILFLFPKGHVEIQRKSLYNIFKSCRFCARMQPRGTADPSISVSFFRWHWILGSSSMKLQESLLHLPSIYYGKE